MEYVTLGRTGLSVSRLCFGTMSFGGDADEETSSRIFARCREAGINFFDCANIYSRGKAEEILGRLAKSCRDELILTSKVWGVMGPGPNDRGLSRRAIFMQVENSLRRLQTDRLEIYFLHHRDPKTPAEETLRAMDDLVRQGKVLHVGISNWSAWQIALGLGLCEREGLARIHVLQPMYSLAKRAAEIEILPLAADQNLGVIPYSPLGAGLLTGKYSPSRRDEKGRLTTNTMYAKRYADASLLEIAQRFADYAAKAGVHPATLAVSWVMNHPAVTAPIIGARNLEQLEPSLAAADYVMSPQQYAQIAALTPPPPLATDRDEERA